MVQNIDTWPDVVLQSIIDNEVKAFKLGKGNIASLTILLNEKLNRAENETFISNQYTISWT